jgi:hypothetical protein
VVILSLLRFGGDDMRFLPVFVFAVLPFAALAQGTLPPVQKAAQGPLAVPVPAADLGLPADADAPKAGALVAAKATDAAMSDFDTDKIAGNDPVAAPLTLRSKAPGALPDPTPTAADFGSGPDGAKLADLAVGKVLDGQTTTYDTDKITGNAETFPPLAERQKAPGLPPTGATAADFGLPADPDAAKTAGLAAQHADSHPTSYDEDKITGNGESAGVGSEYGPLSDRQKQPSELADGVDPMTFGQPVIDVEKEADLGVSKAAIAVPNLEDNDKIAGNPYVAAPLLPRQKAPAVLPDPVADADMGLPAIDAPKGVLEVSKAVASQPNTDDNDKIVGNPVISPPLADRSKAPAFEPAVAGLLDVELGIPANPDAAKTNVTDASKTESAVITAYDEDKIDWNNGDDPAFTEEEGLTESFDISPPSELIAQVRAQLDDPATRTAMLEAVGVRGLAPAAMTAPFQSFVGTLYDLPQLRDTMATEIARAFMTVGLLPDNPVGVGRVAAEYLAAYGEPEARRGVTRRPVPEQRAYLADTLRIAAAMTPAQCGGFLDGTMPADQQRRQVLAAVATWPAQDQTALLNNRAAAIMAAVQDAPPAVPMAAADAETARQTLGLAALAAIDASANGPDLLAAFGDPSGADPANRCAVQMIVIQTALAGTGPEGDRWLRYLIEHGWQN